MSEVCGVSLEDPGRGPWTRGRRSGERDTQGKILVKCGSCSLPAILGSQLGLVRYLSIALFNGCGFCYFGSLADPVISAFYKEGTVLGDRDGNL